MAVHSTSVKAKRKLESSADESSQDDLDLTSFEDEMSATVEKSKITEGSGRHRLKGNGSSGKEKATETEISNVRACLHHFRCRTEGNNVHGTFRQVVTPNWFVRHSLSSFPLGYACLNTVLRNKRPAAESVFCSRTCRIDTIKKKGMEWVKDLERKNCQDLTVIQWNEENNIRFLFSGLLRPFALAGGSFGLATRASAVPGLSDPVFCEGIAVIMRR